MDVINDVFGGKTKFGNVLMIVGLLLTVAGAARWTMPGYRPFDLSTEILHSIVITIAVAGIAFIMGIYYGVWWTKAKQEMIDSDEV